MLYTHKYNKMVVQKIIEKIIYTVCKININMLPLYVLIYVLRIISYIQLRKKSIILYILSIFSRLRHFFDILIYIYIIAGKKKQLRYNIVFFSRSNFKTNTILCVQVFLYTGTLCDNILET